MRALNFTQDFPYDRETSVGETCHFSGSANQRVSAAVDAHYFDKGLGEGNHVEAYVNNHKSYGRTFRVSAWYLAPQVDLN